MKKILLLSFLSAYFLHSNAQLTVWSEPNDTTFIYSLAGPGVTVTNLTRNCATDASGFYNSTAANVGIDSGIVLTSGLISLTPGPNNSSSSSYANGTAGDAALDALIPGYFTYDACYIEFDMTVMADTVRINYVFGSEEYQEYVGSSFNDVFAFWVSGPGITDTVNIATVPGTDVPVAINNVNAFSYSDYYIDNGDGFSEPYASDNTYIQYDGKTVVMEGKIATMPGETYHMKIAVSDAGDQVFDSGVFLETGSLGSLRMGANYYGDGSALAAEENCANGNLEFINYLPGAEDLVFDYHISGTAVNGEDYELINDQITIPAGFSSAILPIVPIIDSETEGDETIILDLFNPQSGYIYNTIELVLKDELVSDYTYSSSESEYTFTNSTTGAESYSWTFGDGTSSVEENPSHTYASAGVYEVCLTATNANGCSSTVCKQVSVSTTLNDLLQASIEIYPNPAAEHFTISLAGPLSNASAVITNMTGAEIMTIQLSSEKTEIETSQFAAGMYYIKISTDDNSVVKTIQIK